MFGLLISINAQKPEVWDSFLVVSIHATRGLLLIRVNGKNMPASSKQELQGFQVRAEDARAATVNGRVLIRSPTSGQFQGYMLYVLDKIGR